MRCEQSNRANPVTGSKGSSLTTGVKAADLAEDEPALSRREAGKAERRQRIIEAARDLIRETGSTGLSMRTLAARAGVSLATPYNLFGSKSAIILALLEDAREFRQRFDAVRTSDPHERIFAAVDLSVDYYVSDPAFYKTLWSAVFDTSDEVRSAIYNPKARGFWIGLAEAACEAGAVQSGISGRLLAMQLMHVFRSAMLDWVVNEIGSEALSSVIELGFAMILSGVAPPEWRGPLQARMMKLNDRLAQRPAAEDRTGAWLKPVARLSSRDEL
jgi:AcrR family transcriptional regulator